MSNENSITLVGYFDVVGRESLHSFSCFTNVDNSDWTVVNLHVGEKIIKNPTIYDIKRNKIIPVIGFLENDCERFKNTKLSFIKSNILTSSFGNVTKEICKTDSSGMYKAYIQPGIYNINIFINNELTELKNQVIQDGLKHEYYMLIQGPIKNKFKDTVSFVYSNYKNVYGKIVDNKFTPIENAEIIILNENGIYVYVKTDKDGNYRFAIENGIYDVKFRSDDCPMKTVNNVEINDNFGFIEQLNNVSKIFGKTKWLEI